MLTTAFLHFKFVHTYLYCLHTLTPVQGEISGLLNLYRALGGFCVAYFQVPWATKHGALQTFGVEAAIVATLFLLVIPVLQYRGRYLRVSNLVPAESHVI